MYTIGNHPFSQMTNHVLKIAKFPRHINKAELIVTQSSDSSSVTAVQFPVQPLSTLILNPIRYNDAV